MGVKSIQKIAIERAIDSTWEHCFNQAGLRDILAVAKGVIIGIVIWIVVLKGGAA